MDKQLIYSVEDDKSIRELINYALKDEGYEVESFENAEDMLAKLNSKMPELILLDIMLPKMDGMEALKIIREKYKNIGIKIIMLTASKTEISKVTGLNCGADDYITKPFSILELIARIKANLRKYIVDVADNILSFMGIKLNIKTRLVYIDDEEINLTVKEFELLKIFMQNADTVIDRERLVTKIWGYEYVGETRTVDIHIKNLRAKLGKYSEYNYVIDTLIIMIIILFAVLLIAFFTSKKMAEAVIAPIKLIKNKLGSAISDGKNDPMSLTKYDEINEVLEEIDTISEHLSRNLNNYQKEKEKLDFIIENIDLGVLALDVNQNIVASNKIAKEFFNFDYKKTVNINKITRNKIVLDNIDSAISNNESIIFDSSYKNGKILETKLLPIESKDIKLIIILCDVTEMRNLSRQKQEFFINASHELNTPLSSILGYSEMQLLSDKLNKPFIETINQEALRMKLLISDMLKISELEENKEIIDDKIDIKKIVEKVIISQTPKAEKKKIVVTNNLETCLLYANYEKITEVVSNLVDNAIKYTFEGGKVEISLKKRKW